MADPHRDLKRRLRRFAKDRGWGRFHTPKNLAMAMSVEAAELVEIFQWLTAAQSARLPKDKRAHLAEEIADVFIYLIRIADHYGIDVVAAADDKMKKNAIKYPARLGAAKIVQ